MRKRNWNNVLGMWPYIYMYVCVCVCVCVWERESTKALERKRMREKEELLSLTDGGRVLKRWFECSHIFSYICINLHERGRERVE